MISPIRADILDSLQTTGGLSLLELAADTGRTTQALNRSIATMESLRWVEWSGGILRITPLGTTKLAPSSNAPDPARAPPVSPSVVEVPGHGDASEALALIMHAARAPADLPLPMRVGWVLARLEAR